MRRILVVVSMLALSAPTLTSLAVAEAPPDPSQPPPSQSPSQPPPNQPPSSSGQVVQGQGGGLGQVDGTEVVDGGQVRSDGQVRTHS